MFATSCSTMFKFLILLFFNASFVFGQTWISRASVVGPTAFFSEVMQDTVSELERSGFSSLQLPEITQNLNLQMYNLRVAGQVNYTNGFIVNIQRIDMNNIASSVVNTSLSGVVTPRAIVRGQLHFRQMRLGYDVEADLEEHGPQRFTGEILHTLATFLFEITRNLNTDEVAVTATLSALTAANNARMIYQPANSITEVLSRNFLPAQNNNGVSSWGPQIFRPIVLDIVTNKIPFPRLCFTNC